MKQKPPLKRSLLFLPLFAYLLAFPEDTLSSAREGLALWYNSVVPVLFPFLLLCGLALRMQLLDPLLALLEKPLHLLLGCSRYGSFAVAAGFLCGFPMGAKVTADLKRQNLINGEEARFLYGFVNNLSPAFILSYLALDQMGQPERRYLYLLIILGTPFLYGILTSLPRRRAGTGRGEGKARKMPEPEPFSFGLLDGCIADAAGNTLRLGAYILLFSILSGAALMLLPGENPVCLALAASIEVTGGIRLLAASPLPWEAKFILVNALAVFGGCSALAQTIGVAGLDREEFRAYIKSRVQCTLLSVLFSGGVLALFR